MLQIFFLLEKNLGLSVHCEAKGVGWEQLSFIHEHKHQAGFWKMNQTQNSPEKKIVIKKGIYIFSRLNLESLLSYFKQARDCKLQSVWIEKNLYKCFVQAQKGKSLNIQYMKDACPTSKQLSAQKRKNNLTFC